MTQVSGRIKRIHEEGKLVNYKDTDSTLGVTQYFCSTHIKEEKLLIKGEAYSPKSAERKALIVFFDSKTGEVQGGKIFYIPSNQKAGE